MSTPIVAGIRYELRKFLPNEMTRTLDNVTDEVMIQLFSIEGTQHDITKRVIDPSSHHIRTQDGDLLAVLDPIEFNPFRESEAVQPFRQVSDKVESLSMRMWMWWHRNDKGERDGVGIGTLEDGYIRIGIKSTLHPKINNYLELRPKGIESSTFDDSHAEECRIPDLVDQFQRFHYSNMQKRGERSDSDKKPREPHPLVKIDHKLVVKITGENKNLNTLISMTWDLFYSRDALHWLPHPFQRSRKRRTPNSLPSTSRTDDHRKE